MTTRPRAAQPLLRSFGPRSALWPRFVGSAHLPLAVPGLAVLAIGMLFRDVWAVQAVLLGVVLVLPGLVALRAVRMPGAAVVRFPVYVPCASLVVLMVGGLVVNFVAPWMGVSQPLRPVPLLVGVVLICLGLLAVGQTAPDKCRISVPSISFPRAATLGFLLVPGIAAAGAIRMTNGVGNGVAIAGACLLVTAIVAVVCARGLLRPADIAMALFAIGMALFWAYSLRGTSVFGSDIATELAKASSTVEQGRWETVHTNDAYGAMLSVSVLPASLHSLTGIGLTTILKAVFPLLLGLVPVGAFALALRLASPRWAFLAACLLSLQLVEGPLAAVARQEVAFLLFVGLLVALIDDGLSLASRTSVVAMLAAGIVVSHYSTAYFLIASFLVALPLLALSRGRRGNRVALGSLGIALITTIAAALVWYGPVTGSSGSAFDTFHKVRSEGLRVLPNAAPGANPISAYLDGNTPRAVSAGQYQAKTITAYRRDHPWIVPVSSTAPAPPLQDAGVAEHPARLRPLASLVHGLSFGTKQIVNLLLIAGGIGLLLGRRVPPAGRVVGALSLGTLAVLVPIRLSGTLAEVYNPERSQGQALIVGAAAAAWLLTLLARHRAVAVAAAGIATCGVLAMATSASGLSSVLFGGAPRGSLQRTGEDYERFFVSAPELAAASWLTDHRHPGGVVFADRYGRLRLFAFAAWTWQVLPDVVPGALDQHSWVYASRTNVVDGRARGALGVDVVSYRYPANYISSALGTVYSNQESRVFHTAPR